MFLDMGNRFQTLIKHVYLNFLEIKQIDKLTLYNNIRVFKILIKDLILFGVSTGQECLKTLSGVVSKLPFNTCKITSIRNWEATGLGSNIPLVG